MLILLYFYLSKPLNAGLFPYIVLLHCAYYLYFYLRKIIWVLLQPLIFCSGKSPCLKWILSSMVDRNEDDETGAGRVAIRPAVLPPWRGSVLLLEYAVIKKVKDLHLHSSVTHRGLQVRQQPNDITHYLNSTNWTVLNESDWWWGLILLQSVHEVWMCCYFGRVGRDTL